MKKNAAVANTMLQPWRYRVVLAVLAVLACILVFRLVGLQLAQGEGGVDYLQRAGDARSLRTVQNAAHRGMISDRNGRPLAISTPVKSLWIEPKKIQAEKVFVLAQALGLDVDKLSGKIAKNATKEFLYVARQLAPSKADEIMQFDINGLHAATEYKRYYPAADVSAHLLGFTDTDDRGVDGLEWTYNTMLSGKSGTKRVLKNRRGEIIQHIESVREVAHGEDLQLSIDLRLQYYAHKELKAAVEKFGAKSGSVVVLDVHSNEVLAMVNEPTFNPNERSTLDMETVRNRAVTDVFEPGSTMKPLAMIAALESGRYTPNTVIDTSPGYISVEGKLLADSSNYGQLDLTGILSKSSQVGTSKIALDLGGPAIRGVLQRFGLGQSLATGFPGESFGSLPDYTSWHPLHTVTMAYGYGVSATPLQLAQCYSILANKGLRKDVSLVRVSDPVYSERVVDEQLVTQINHMLAEATKQGGTGTRATTERYSVAGKTGTLHRLGKQGYEGDRYVAVFAGFAPAANPRLAAAVFIDDPGVGTYYGGEVAAPVFSRIVGESLRLLNVAPDALQLATAH
ncbi:MAG: peptidoglycan D,D-transpeptidase FtsI family protein [Pseudomonadales bacterium]